MREDTVNSSVDLSFPSLDCQFLFHVLLKIVNFCFMYFIRFLTFRIIKSSYKGDPLSFKKCLTLFLALFIALKSTFSGINLATWDLLLTYAKHIGIQNQFILRYMRIILLFSKQSQLDLMSGFWALKSPLNCIFAAGPRSFHLNLLWVFHGQVWPQPSTGALWTLTPVYAL